MIEIKFPEDAKLKANYNLAKKRMERNMHRISAASWINHETKQFYVCSVRTIPGTNGHPYAEITGTWAAGLEK